MLAYTQVKLKRIVLLDTPAGAFKKEAFAHMPLVQKSCAGPIVLNKRASN